MREILFRGKCKMSGDWISGDIIHGVGSKDGNLYILPRNINLAYVKHCHHLDGVQVTPETVGQYSGTDDKNSVRIFEGDILLCDWCFRKMPSRGHLNKKYPDLIIGYSLVRFENGEFKFEFIKPIPEHEEAYYKNEGVYSYIGYTRSSYYKVQSHVEVVGNIYDNPELLITNRKA